MEAATEDGRRQTVPGRDEARVTINRAVIGLCHMQVCAVADATDEEILDACNVGNPSGTRAGWSQVIRDAGPTGKDAPIQCAGDASRTHFLVVC